MERHRAEGMSIDKDTMPRWTGDTMDRDIAVQGLLQRDDLLQWPRQPPAEPDSEDPNSGSDPAARAGRGSPPDPDAGGGP